MKEPEKEHSDYSLKAILKKMLHYVTKYKFQILFYFIFSCIAISVSLFIADLVNNLITAAIETNNVMFSTYIIRAIIAIAVNVISIFLSRYIYNKFKAGIMLDIKNKSIEHLQNLPVSFIENNHTGDILSRYTDDLSSVQNFIGTEILDSVINIFAFIVTSVYLIYIDWRIYFISIILMPPVLYLSTKISRPMTALRKEAHVNTAKANAIAKDSYSGIFILKSFNLQTFFYNKFAQYNGKSLQKQIQSVHKLKWMPPFNIILWTSPFTICLIYGAYLAMRKEISPGYLPVLVYLLNNIVWSISNIPQTVANIRSSLGSAQRFFKILDIPVERAGGNRNLSPSGKICVEFKGVSYTYYGSEADKENKEKENVYEVLDGFSMKVESGKKVALVGQSGCGKSTVLKLIMGFYDIQQGNIEILGHDALHWDLHALRSKISFVSQDSYLFPVTVFENILCGRSNATKEEVLEAAKAANAHEFIMELPDGYETHVGEKGIKLSGGQKQRISIARAFLKDAGIVLLDEATSSLDTISESLVQDSINRLMKNRTALIVAHRLSTVKDADEILVMEEGRIKEKGTHEELMAKNGVYFGLYNRQAGEQYEV